MYASPCHPLSGLTKEEVRDLIALLKRLRLPLAQFYQVLPEPLTQKERESRGALLSRLTPFYVRRTAWALARPGAFPEISIDPEHLVLQEELASLLRNLECHFGLLQQLTHDFFLSVEAGAQRDAMAAHDQVALEGASPFGVPEGHDLRAALLDVSADFRHNKGRRRKPRARRRRAAQAD